MTLPLWTQDSDAASVTIICYDGPTGTARLNLSAVTAVTGALRSRSTGVARAITGTLAITNAAQGVITWQPSAADMADADAEIQLTLTRPSGAITRTYRAAWTVEPRIG